MMLGKEVANKSYFIARTSFYILLCFCLCNFFICHHRLAEAADKENCQLCHRYSGLGNFDEKTTRKKIYYVNEKIYRNSVHGEVRCSHCHTDVKEIPHKPAKQVDCSVKCHVKEPSTGKDFSHKIVVKEFKEGAHGKNPLFIGPEGQPKCKYCHQNPVYQPLSGLLARQHNTEANALARCLECHEKPKWTKRFLKHFTSRTMSRWDNKGIVDLCTSCHDDAEMMARYGKESTQGFRNTFHWRNIKYEAKDAANCVSCHAPPSLGYPVHRMKRAKDSEGPLSIKNRFATCGQHNCHNNPTEAFVKGGIHSFKGRIELLTTALESGETKLSSEQREQLEIELKEARMEHLGNQITHYIQIWIIV